MLDAAWQTGLASSLACAAVVLAMLLAARGHRRRLSRVPVRIHVAGSRGKTSTARLIGAGLAAAGRRVLVKTTGTEPLVVLPNGNALMWPRFGPPSISELSRFFRMAAEWRADVAVVEAMAIEPEYLWASERYLVQATHLVVTNLRPDHEELLPGGPAALVAAVANLVPHRGRVFLTGESDSPRLLEACARRGSSVEVVSTEDVAPLDINRRVAFAVCTALGVPGETVERGMAGAGDDPGAFFIAELDSDGPSCRFASAFACNDTVSFLEIWAAHRPQASPVVLLNGRPDRPLRTRAFLETLAHLSPPVRLVLSGRVPVRWALAAGFPRKRVASLRARTAAAAVAELRAAAGQGGMIWGVGNYAGLGRQIIALLRNRPAAC